jgi:hypothetical protein
MNEPPKEECTYTLGIQTEWQLSMMVLHGHNSAVSFDATFGTNTPRVNYHPPLLIVRYMMFSLVLVERFLLSIQFSLIRPVLPTYYRNVLFRLCRLCPIVEIVFPNPTYYLQYPLYTVMVFDEWHNGIPVAFIITSKCAEEDILCWLSALRDRVVQHRPEWHPNAVVVDCAKAELNCIEFVH